MCKIFLWNHSKYRNTAEDCCCHNQVWDRKRKEKAFLTAWVFFFCLVFLLWTFFLYSLKQLGLSLYGAVCGQVLCWYPRVTGALCRLLQGGDFQLGSDSYLCTRRRLTYCAVSVSRGCLIRLNCWCIIILRRVFASHFRKKITRSFSHSAKLRSVCVCVCVCVAVQWCVCSLCAWVWENEGALGRKLVYHLNWTSGNWYLRGVIIVTSANWILLFGLPSYLVSMVVTVQEVRVTLWWSLNFSEPRAQNISRTTGFGGALIVSLITGHRSQIRVPISGYGYKLFHRERYVTLFTQK